MIRSHNRTKIIATIGPASNDYETILEMVKAGVDVFRMNFSHGTHKGHKAVFDHIHKINRAYKLNIGILADLQGPKIRLGEVKGDGVELEDEAEVTITTKECVSTANKLYITYDALAKDISKGDKILIDDGKVELQVINSNGKDQLTAKVIHGGTVTSKKGVNLPQTKLSVSAITRKDLKDLDFALENGANWIALSFVRKPDEIHEIRKIINAKDKVKIIAKIEKPEALDVIDDIITASDGIMIARGDLAVEVPMERMPIIQKDIVRRCIKASKPVVVATQIMESMITASRPTRAEINDVANGMIDGADALMLSGETAVGNNPVLVIETLVKLMKHVEQQEVVYNKNLAPREDSRTFLSDAVCFSACRIAESIDAAAIVGMTRSGYTAFMVSSYRPHAQIYIFTDNEDLLNVLSLVWGVEAFYYDKFVSTDETVTDIIQILKYEKLVKSGDVLVNTGTMPLHKRGRTNMVRVTKID